MKIIPLLLFNMFTEVGHESLDCWLEFWIGCTHVLEFLKSLFDLVKGDFSIPDVRLQDIQYLQNDAHCDPSLQFPSRWVHSPPSPGRLPTPRRLSGGRVPIRIGFATAPWYHHRRR